jgi:hypothetical protein
VVFKVHAGDLDLHDRRRTRRQSQARLASANSLPANPPAISVNNLSNFGVRWQSEAATALWIAFARNRTFKFATSISKAPSSLRFAGALQKKEDQCQES